MKKLLKKIAKDEDGAVSVDWVVLTAAIVGLAVGAGAAILGSVNTLSGDISSELSSVSVENGS